MNAEIRNYQIAIRLNVQDGFSEVIAKSILLGQYPITQIQYPFIEYINGDESLIDALIKLKYKTEPNPAEKWWREELNKPLL